MKKLSVAFLFCLTSTIANAQIGSGFTVINKQVVCGPVQVVFKALAEPDIDEKPIWLGKDESGKSELALFVNQKTGGFTLVQFNEQAACILALGGESKLHLPSAASSSNL